VADLDQFTFRQLAISGAHGIMMNIQATRESTHRGEFIARLKLAINDMQRNMGNQLGVQRGGAVTRKGDLKWSASTTTSSSHNAQNRDRFTTSKEMQESGKDILKYGMAKRWPRAVLSHQPRHNRRFSSISLPRKISLATVFPDKCLALNKKDFRGQQN
jgi:hypothetical protein